MCSSKIVKCTAEAPSAVQLHRARRSRVGPNARQQAATDEVCHRANLHLLLRLLQETAARHVTREHPASATAARSRAEPEQNQAAPGSNQTQERATSRSTHEASMKQSTAGRASTSKQQQKARSKNHTGWRAAGPAITCRAAATTPQAPCQTDRQHCNDKKAADRRVSTGQAGGLCNASRGKPRPAVRAVRNTADKEKGEKARAEKSSGRSPACIV
jgi:hypothetical protein